MAGQRADAPLDAGVRVLDTPAIEAQRWIFQLAKDRSRTPGWKAISLAIDRNVIKDLLLGYARPVVGPSARPDRPHEPRPEALRPGEGRQILKEAGYQNLSIDFVLMKDLYPKQLEIVRRWPRCSGRRDHREHQEPRDRHRPRGPDRGNYDMFFSGWAHMPHDPDWYLGQWFTKGGRREADALRQPPIEQLIAEGRVPDPKVRQQKYEEIEKALWEDEPEIWPYYSVAIYAVSDKLQNFQARRDYYVLLYDVRPAKPASRAPPAGQAGPPPRGGGTCAAVTA